MPRCVVCKTETPITEFYLLREYNWEEGHYWYFCSLEHLSGWVTARVGEVSGEERYRRR